MEQLFLVILNMSLTSCWVIGLILVVRLLLKRAPKGYSYALWGVVLFRLLCPTSLPSPFSLLPVNPKPIPMDIAMAAAPRIATGIESLDRAVSSVLPAAEPYSSANPLQIQLAIAVVLWLTVTVLLLICAAFSLLRLRRQLGSAVLAGETGPDDLAKGVRIFELENLPTPFVLGFLRPAIYLPSGLAGADRAYVLIHEQIHIQRKDYAVKLLAYGVLCIHWFNPLVWLAYFLMEKDMEMSCDERVLRSVSESARKDYSRSLLSMAADRPRVWAGGGPLAFGENSVKGRIRNVLRYHSPSRRMITAAVLVCAAAVLGLVSDPVRAEGISPDLSPIFQPVALGTTAIPLKNGEQAEVTLMMTAGRVLNSNDPDFAYGGGLQDGVNYTGTFQLQAKTKDGGGLCAAGGL